MSDESKKKISYQEMSFRYDYAIRKAVENLFSTDSDHGWSEDEFQKIFYEEAVKNAFEATNERVLH